MEPPYKTIKVKVKVNFDYFTIVLKSVWKNSNIPRRVSPTVKQNSNGDRSKSKQGRREGEREKIP